MVKVKPRNKKPLTPPEPSTNEQVSNIALGAAAGCLIGAAAALFFAPKPKGHKFTRALDSMYDQVSDTAQEYAHEAMDKGHKIYDNAKDSIDHICHAASDAFSSYSTNRNIVLGIIGAGLIGASAVYALSQRSSEEEEGLVDKIKACNWLDVAKFVADKFSGKSQEEDDSEDNEEHYHPVHRMMDWAMTGLNIWQEMKKRR
jgi:gas vesicle protein